MCQLRRKKPRFAFGIVFILLNYQDKNRRICGGKMVIFWGAKCFLKVQKTARQRKFLSENRDENAGKKKAGFRAGLRGGR